VGKLRVGGVSIQGRIDCDGNHQGRPFMQPRRIRLRPEYQFSTHETAASIQPEVTVKLGEILPILADALAHDRAWLADFTKDSIKISRDLHEVLLAYRAFRREAA
jgi:hypothetical protein